MQELLPMCLYRWKWFVLSVVFTLGLGMLYVLHTQPVYTRTSSILIKSNTTANGSYADELITGGISAFNVRSDVRNEMTAMKSPYIVGNVVRQMHLNVNYSSPGRFYDRVLYGKDLPINVSLAQGKDEEPVASFSVHAGKNGTVTLTNFEAPNRDDIKDKTVKGRFDQPLRTPVGIVVVTRTPYYKSTDYDVNVDFTTVDAAVAAYSAKLNIVMDNDKNDILNLTMRDVSPQRATDFLNTLIEAYNKSWVEDKNKEAVSTSQFINERLSVIEKELGNVDSDISSFKSQHLIPDLQEASRLYMNKASSADEQILNLSNSRSVLGFVRGVVADNSRRDQLLPGNLGIASTAVSSLISEYNTELLRRNNMVENSSVNNPLVVEADQRLAAMRGSIITSIDNEINALNTQINSFQASEHESQQRIASNPTQAQYLLSVERQQKVKESLYLYLLEKREENELSQAFTAYNTRIIAPPTGPSRPTSPVTRNVLAIAFILGLLLPVGIIILRENLDNKVRGRKDIEGLPLPFLGELPQSGKRYRRTDDDKESRLVVKDHKRDMINEAFRVIRTNLDFMLDPDKKSHVIMLSSLNPGSGKTFIALNMAATYSLSDKRVVLVDLDLRKATLSHSLNAPRHGVSDYLSGRNNDIDSLIMKVPEYDNLSLMPAGAIPPNPAELLQRDRLKELIEHLRSEYDLIILDCPPADVVADAAIITKSCDMTLFVIRSGNFDRRMLPIIEEHYEQKKFANMTLVLNSVPVSENHYGYRYGYTYGYGIRHNSYYTKK